MYNGNSGATALWYPYIHSVGEILGTNVVAGPSHSINKFGLGATIEELHQAVMAPVDGSCGPEALVDGW